MRKQFENLSDEQKLGLSLLGLLGFLFGSKILDGFRKAIFFMVWLAIIVGFIGFCLLMAWLTGA